VQSVSKLCHDNFDAYIKFTSNPMMKRKKMGKNVWNDDKDGDDDDDFHSKFLI